MPAKAKRRRGSVSAAPRTRRRTSSSRSNARTAAGAAATSTTIAAQHVVDGCASDTHADAQGVHASSCTSLSSSPPHVMHTTPAQEARFFADVQHVVLRRCCDVLPRLTVSTSTASFAAYTTDATVAADGVSVGIDSNSDNKTSTTAAADGGGTVLTSAHEDIYRTVLHTIAASCALGHRSCQVLWGPRGCGKHRIVRAVAQTCAQRRSTFVLQLDGGQLRSEAAALACIAQQLAVYLCAPQSSALRSASWPLRSGELAFCRLYHMDAHVALPNSDSNVNEDAKEQHEAVVAYVESNDDDDEDGDSDKDSDVENVAPWQPRRRHRPRRRPPRAAAAVARAANDVDGTVSDRHAAQQHRRRRQQQQQQQPQLSSRHALHERNATDSDAVSSSSSSSSLSSECSSASDVGDATTAAAALLTHSASDDDVTMASALSALKHALLHIRSAHTHLVVCIRHVDVFAVWCDQLLYVLAGLMHDADDENNNNDNNNSSRSSSGNGRHRSRRSGGGVSLLLTSPSPDMRHLEKRLSSRLTCETRHVPLLPWSVCGVLSAVLSRVRAEAATVLHSAITTRRGVSSSTTTTATATTTKNAAAAAVAQWVRESRRMSVGWRRDDESNDTAAAAAAAPSLLYAHATLFVEAAVAMCDELLRQLRRGAGNVHGADTTECNDDKAEANAADTHNNDDDDNTTLARLVDEVHASDVALAECGATVDVVLTATTRLLCRAVAGVVDVCGEDGRAAMRAWLRSRRCTDDDDDVAALYAARPDHKGTNTTTHTRDKTTASVVCRGVHGVCAQLHAVARSSAVCAQWRCHTTATRASSSSPSTSSSPSSLSLPSSLPLTGPHSRSLAAVMLANSFDMLDDGRLLRDGYGAREVFLLLVQMLQHADVGVTSRSGGDLLVDVSSAMGTRAAAALDTAAYRHALTLLCRWRLLSVASRGGDVALCGGSARVRELVHAVLQRRRVWCEDVLGLEDKEWLRIRNTT